MLGDAGLVAWPSPQMPLFRQMPDASETFVPGNVLVAHSVEDKAAYELLNRAPVESLEHYLRARELRLHEEATMQFARIFCPPGSERATIERLTLDYGRLLRESYGEERRSFDEAVFAVNSVLVATSLWGRRARASPVSAAEFTPGSHFGQYTDALGLDKACPCAAEVTVLIVDSGVAADLPFGSRVDHSFIGDRTGSQYDELGHGTAMAMVIRALAPTAKLISFKVIDDRGKSSEFDALAAIMADSDADVVNLSLASQLHDYYCGHCGNWSQASRVDVLGNAIRQVLARRRQPIVVAGAGNDGGSQLGFPARFAEVVAVGALTSNGRLAPYSNSGEEDERGRAHPRRHVMPGGAPSPQESVLASTRLNEPWGTSFAAAFATGVIARLCSCNRLDRDDILRFVESNALRPGPAPAPCVPTLRFG